MPLGMGSLEYRNGEVLGKSDGDIEILKQTSLNLLSLHLCHTSSRLFLLLPLPPLHHVALPLCSHGVVH